MPRLLVFIAAPLALAAVACASDDAGPTGTQTGQTAPAASPTEDGVAEGHAEPVPAVAAPDQEAYRLGAIERRFVQETCFYDAGEGLADCGERGIFALEPLPASEDATCVIGLVGGDQPEFVLCSEPAGGAWKFYIIENVTATPQAS